jgi:hypothetical protein
MSKQIVDNYVNTLANTIQTVYSASVDTVIDSFTAANTSGVNASYKAYIVSSTGATKPQIPFKVVVRYTNDLGIGIVNQIIPAGGELQVESSATDSIYFTVTGREFSS